MSARESELTTLCREIETFLARARRDRPVQQAAPLLDLDQLCAGRRGTALVAHLSGALEGWAGQLQLRAADETFAPQVCAGDRLTIDPEETADAGDLVVAFADGALHLLRLTRLDGRRALVGGDGQARPLGPAVAILGPVVEVRRWLSRR
jgi:hypothetical protein